MRTPQLIELAKLWFRVEKTTWKSQAEHILWLPDYAYPSFFEAELDIPSDEMAVSYNDMMARIIRDRDTISRDRAKLYPR